VIAPGDIVVGDEDGVVAFSQPVAAELLEAVRSKQGVKQQCSRASARGAMTVRMVERLPIRLADKWPAFCTHE
jgi:regulator of RNase E activity RraA